MFEDLTYTYNIERETTKTIPGKRYKLDDVYGNTLNADCRLHEMFRDKDGQFYLPTGEFRVPQDAEYFLSRLDKNEVLKNWVGTSRPRLIVKPIGEFEYQEEDRVERTKESIQHTVSVSDIYSNMNFSELKHPIVRTKTFSGVERKFFLTGEFRLPIIDEFYLDSSYDNSKNFSMGVLQSCFQRSHEEPRLILKEIIDWKVVGDRLPGIDEFVLPIFVNSMVNSLHYEVVDTLEIKPLNSNHPTHRRNVARIKVGSYLENTEHIIVEPVFY
jgi:hypothetical protein